MGRGRLIVVLGMHRSGTSALTRGLQVLGVDLGDNLHPAGSDNPKGFWEDRHILGINNELLGRLSSGYDRLGLAEWNVQDDSLIEPIRTRAVQLVREKTDKCTLWGFKDPRTARLLPFWQSIFAEVGCEASYVIAVRNPLSVIESLKVRNGFEPLKSQYLWLEHLVPAVLKTRGARRVVVDYDRLLDDPSAQLLRIGRELALPLPDPSELAAYQDAFLEEGLRHTRFTIDNLRAYKFVVKQIIDGYEWLQRLAGDEESVNGPETERLFSALHRDLCLLGPALRLIGSQDQRIEALSQALALRCAEVDKLKHSLGDSGGNSTLAVNGNDRLITANHPTNSGSVPVLSGFLEKYNRFRISGWAISKDDSLVPELDVFVNNVLVGTCVPTRPRADLGRERAAFEFTFPSGLFGCEDTTAQIAVKFRQTQRDIGNSPVTCAICSSDIDGIVTGQESFLFLKDECIKPGDVARTHEAERMRWTSTFTECVEELKDRTLYLTWFVMPDKARVYADKLPVGCGDSPHDGKYEQWRSLLPSNEKMIGCYPLEVLRSERKISDTYSRGDSCWNDYGAYVAYSALCDSIKPIADVHAIEFSEKTFTVAYRHADLLAKLGGVCVEKQWVWPDNVFRCKLIEASNQWGSGRRVRYRSTDEAAASLRVLVFNNTYNYRLERFIASTFVETEFISSAHILWNEVDIFRPDLIVVEQLESTLFRVSPEKISTD